MGHNMVLSEPAFSVGISEIKAAYQRKREDLS